MNEDQQRTYLEFQRWSRDRTQRVRNEQIAARRQNVNTRLRDRMIQMHSDGSITDEFLLLYAVSGPLPQQGFISDREKQLWWEQRVESNLGVEWRTYLGTRADFMKMPKQNLKVNWAKEGF